MINFIYKPCSQAFPFLFLSAVFYARGRLGKNYHVINVTGRKEVEGLNCVNAYMLPVHVERIRSIENVKRSTLLGLEKTKDSKTGHSDNKQ